MNKNDVVTSVAQTTGFTKKDITAVVEAFTDVVTNSLVAGEDVKISGFGTFTVADRAPRTGRNPQTGEEIAIAASKAPKFKPSTTLKDIVNNR